MNDAERYLGTQISRGKIVPLIGPEVKGTLGLVHLPRTWLKALLLASDSLAEDWGCGAGGLDKKLMDFVGIDRDAFVPWLLQEFPTYAECETWVRANARSLDDASIARANNFFTTAPLPRGLGPKFREFLGIDDESVDVGIRLVNFDDWQAVHWYVMKYGKAGGPIVPAISPGCTGLLGVAQLPRDWLITLLRAMGLLPSDYRYADDSSACPVLQQLGIDPSTAHAFIAAERPTEVQYETWLRARATMGKDTIAQISSAFKPDTARDVEAYDWDVLHRELDKRRASAPVRTAGVYSFSVTTSLSAPEYGLRPQPSEDLA